MTDRAGSFTAARFRLAASMVVVAAMWISTIAVAAGAPPPRRPSHAAAAAATGGQYVPLAPARVLDTRVGAGAPQRPIPGRGTIAVTVAGAGGVPASGVSAVVLNLTVTNAAEPGYITAFPDGDAKPTVSNINFAAGDTRAHLAVVQLGSNGAVDFYNGSSGSTDLVADVSGYYRDGAPTAGGAFGSLVPVRLLDTRDGTGVAAAAPVIGGQSVSFVVTGRGGVPASGVSAVVLNITVADAQAHGYVELPNRPDQLATSLVNFSANGRPASNLLVAPVDQNGRVRLINVSAGSADFIADVAGYFVAGAPAAAGLFGSVTTSRLVDTRRPTDPRAIPAGGTLDVSVTARRGVPSDAISAVLLNVTVVAPKHHGFLSVYASSAERPATSNLNFTAGAIVSNAVVAPVGPDGKVALYNSSVGATDVLVDIAGFVGPVPGSLTWSGRQEIDPPAGGLASVSCPTQTFCAAVDTTAHALYFNGSAWSAPQSQSQSAFAADPPKAVSCVSATFCVATSEHTFYRYDGTRWTASAPVADSLGQVSCATTTFCVALAGDDPGAAPNQVVTYDGVTWSSAHTVTSDGYGLWSVSCPSDTFCLAGSNDEVYTFRSGVWSSPHQLTPLPEVDNVLEVSCSTATFCVAAGEADEAATFNGTSWSDQTPIDPAGGDIDSVSCVSAAFCVAGDDNGGVIRYNGSTWGSRTVLYPAQGQTAAQVATSCATAAMCVSASPVSGQASVYRGSSWSSPAVIDPPAADASALSCVSSSFCVAVGTNGAAIVMRGGVWGRPVFIGQPGPSSVSCVSTTFCVAVFDGTSNTFDGTSWGTTVNIPTEASYVSCVSSTFCMSVSYAASSTYDGTSWSAPVSIGATNAPTGLSCVSATACTLLQSEQAIQYRNGSWSSPTTIGASELDGLSCVSVSFCTAVDLATGAAFTFDGMHWTKTNASHFAYSFEAVSCASTTMCLGVDARGNVETFDGTGWTVPIGLDSGYPFVAVSCSSPTFCVALDYKGGIITGT